MSHALAWAAGSTGFTFLMTTLGAAMVFFFRKAVSANIQRIFLGFAAGVMIAASVWSLLIPAMEEAQAAGVAGWLPAGGGFVLGVAFLMLLDSLLPHLHPGAKQAEGLDSKWQRSTMLMLAVTLHNLPEGMVVGLAAALALHGDADAVSGALALSLGIGLQNIPEGAAVSLPLTQSGRTRGQSFAAGAASGLVEPLGAVLAFVLAEWVGAALPWLMSAAAGCMVCVTAQEMIPQAVEGDEPAGVVSIVLGFALMMALDVAL